MADLRTESRWIGEAKDWKVMLLIVWRASRRYKMDGGRRTLYTGYWYSEK